MKHSRGLWLALLVLGAGCTRAGFEAERPPASDGPRVDAAPDLPRDAPGDRAVAPEMTPPDQALPDLALPDITLPTTPPCGGGTTEVESYGPTMKICSSGGTNGFNQCGAALYCNVSGGWKVCTASQFLARGGKTRGTTVDAWIKGCVRNGSGLMQPTDSYCSCGGAVDTTLIDVAWDCNTSAPAVESMSFFLAVETAQDCYALGASAAQAEAAHWYTEPSNTLLSATVCCW